MMLKEHLKPITQLFNISLERHVYPKNAIISKGHWLLWVKEVVTGISQFVRNLLHFDSITEGGNVLLGFQEVKISNSYLTHRTTVCVIPKANLCKVIGGWHVELS